MAAPPPGLYTAQAFWEDASCGLTSAPLVPAARIDYSFANGGDCSASTLPPGCAAAASNGGWYHEDACVAAAAASTYANSFWGNFSRVQRAVYPDAQCNQMPSAIHEYPYGFCTKTVGAQSATINGVNYPYFSERFSINATDGTLFWSIYSDNSCNHFSASVNYGQQITSDCIHNTKTTFLYYHGLAAYTTYSSSDCTQPTGIQIQASPVDCETSKSSACFQDVTTDYITSQCGQTLDALSLAKAKFGSQPFALVNYYVDQACSIPLEPAVLLLNKCITRNSSGLPSLSYQVGLTADNSSIDVSFFTRADCSGSISSHEVHSVDGRCSNLAITSLHNLVVPATTINASSPDSTGASSTNVGTNVGAIVGGVVGGVAGFCLTIAVFMLLFKKKIKRSGAKKAPVESPNLGFLSTKAQMPAPAEVIDLDAYNSSAPFIVAQADVASVIPAALSISDSPIPMDTKLSNITGPIYASNAIASPSLAELPRTATGKLRHETRPITVDNPDDAHEPDTTDYVAFGDLYLPANPAGWSIAQVCAWVGQNGGTEDMLAFLSGQEIDGKALLRLRADEFDFTTMGRRIRFEEAVEKLKRIHEEYGARMEATRDPDAEPPLYQL